MVLAHTDANVYEFSSVNPGIKTRKASNLSTAN